MDLVTQENLNIDSDLQEKLQTAVETELSRHQEMAEGLFPMVSSFFLKYLPI